MRFPLTARTGMLIVALGLVLSVVVLRQVVAGTLVDAKNAPTPGIATKVDSNAKEKSVTITLAGANADAVVTALKAKYSGVKIEKTAADKVKVSGAAPADILKKLATIDVGGGGGDQVAANDPFANLGGDSGLQIADGSASIRARKRASLGKQENMEEKVTPAGTPAAEKAPEKADTSFKLSEQGFAGTVKSVEKQKWPMAVAVVQVTTAPRDSRYARAKVGADVEITVEFKGTWSKGDENLGNLVINFLQAGDKVVCEIVGFQGGKYTCGQLARTK